MTISAPPRRRAPAKSKNPATTGAISAPPPMGDNLPPEPTSAEAIRAKLVEHQAIAEKWLKFEVATDDDAERIAAFRKQVASIKKDAEGALKGRVDPLNKQIAELREQFRPIIERVGLILGPIDRKITEFANAKRERLRAEQEAARKAAEEAKREAERAAERAMNSGSIFAAEDAMEAARSAEKAEKAADKLDSAKVSIGSSSSVGNVKKALAIRTFEKVEVVDVVAAVTFLLKAPPLRSIFLSAAAQAAREYRRNNPDVTDIPGIAIVIEEKVV